MVTGDSKENAICMAASLSVLVTNQSQQRQAERQVMTNITPNVGDRLTIMKGWELEVTKPGEAFVIFNPGPNGEHRFYELVPGPYSPLINEEPEAAFPPPCATYVNRRGESSSPTMRIKGIICKSESGAKGEILYRGNLTNFFKKDGGVLVQDGLKVEIKGRCYKLVRLVAENKNRILGYIGFYLPEETAANDTVEVLEVEDLA